MRFHIYTARYGGMLLVLEAPPDVTVVPLKPCEWPCPPPKENLNVVQFPPFPPPPLPSFSPDICPPVWLPHVDTPAA